MPKVKVENELELYYEVYGNGIPVVFINGLNSSLESWYHQIPLLNNGYKKILYDCRGQGRSDKPKSGYSGGHHTRDLKSMLSHLKISRAHLVGHSFGGFIALNYAISYPDDIITVTVSNSTSEASPLIEKILMSWVEAQKCGGLDLRFDISLPWLYSEEFIKNNPKKIRLFKSAFKKNDLDAVKNITMESLQNNATGRLNEINAPTLIIVGEDDILTPLKHSINIKRLIKNSRLCIIKECGHVPPVEKPQEFSRLILDFLNENTNMTDLAGKPC